MPSGKTSPFEDEDALAVSSKRETSTRAKTPRSNPRRNTTSPPPPTIVPDEVPRMASKLRSAASDSDPTWTKPAISSSLPAGGGRRSEQADRVVCASAGDEAAARSASAPARRCDGALT